MSVLDKYKVKFKKKNTKIYDSFRLDNYEIDVLTELIILKREQQGLKVTRTKKSYVREIKAHNRLYKLGLFKSHVTDTDLEEPIKWWVELIYRIIGF